MLVLRGYLTASGNYSTGGDTLDLSTDSGSSLVIPPGLSIPFSAPPIGGWAQGSAGYSFAYIPGTTLANGKVKINSASGTEVSAGSYPAGISGDTNIYCEIEFARLQ